MELQEQVAIVTGAGRGIGRATALELARMGADIVVAELDQANAERTATEVRGCGRRALVVPHRRYVAQRPVARWSSKRAPSLAGSTFS